MKQIILIALAAAAFALTGCKSEEDKKAASREKETKPTFMFWNFRKEIVSTEYHIPEMKKPTAAKYLEARLRQIPGYEKSEADLETNTLTVHYQSSTVRSMNFEEAIALAGFSVNKRPADPNARIPEGVL